MKALFRASVCALAIVGLVAVGSSGAMAQGKIVLQGASQFDEKHAFTRLMR